uniref:Uncharacterized protein n=1 Tax=Trichuris muris TaxID=70415 RepID=A0A5S6QST9_TRIMR
MEAIAELQSKQEKTGEQSLDSPLKKLPRKASHQCTTRRSTIYRGRRSSSVKVGVIGGPPNMQQVLAESFPEIAAKIERLEAYRTCLRKERESAAKFVANVQAEHDASLKDLQEPSQFDVSSLTLSEKSILQGTADYQSIWQALARYRQATRSLADMFRQLAHKQAVLLDQQLRASRAELQAALERRTAG